ncbi:cytochrome P450 [Coprinellus micaceus]|uniref:Cytochrome P450 n=1 Tax=Coprinellus micaceus TaxID=71717 RepID=A0A4Y7TW09_COPMI|nr:cytochrome P450 [Coprinellus micaceus]
MSSPLALSLSSNLLPLHIVLLTIAAVIVCHVIVGVYRSMASLGFLPGKIMFFSPAMVLTQFVLPRIPWISGGKNMNFVNKYSEYEKLGISVYRVEVTSSRTRFPKPVEEYGALAFFGGNIVVSEGDEWKKYRKVAAPAFSEKNNRLVWEETVQIVEDLFTDVWGDQKTVTVDHCIDITLPLALFVIGAAGFGKRMSWKDTEVASEGHKLSFKQALHHVASDVFIKLGVPHWAMGLTERTRKAQESFDELEKYISEMIQERVAEGAEEKNDLFSNLLKSNSEDTGPNTLTERELAGNIFIFLIAGHETTAHTLCFAFAFLALYPEEQEKIYGQIKEALPDGRLPAYEDRTKLDRCMAAYYETMRHVPPVTFIPKTVAEDTTLTTTTAQGHKVVIPVPKGTLMGIDTAGLHYNPRYWEDPEAFKPDRAGPRSCIGRKFFESEGIAALALFLMRYKISIKEELQFATETFEQRRARVLSARGGITVTCVYR